MTSLLALCELMARAAHAETLEVGPGKAYPKPCAAIAAAHDNDVIEIDALGDYGGDVCPMEKNGLTLRGVGGRAKIDAQGKSSGGKAIWVISGHDTTVENLEFSGASVPDKNGAGIRQEGDNLTVRGSYFHDNDDGILSDASAQSQILVEYSEFAHNGFGDGYSHNMYIGNVARFTLRYSYSHDSKVGHLVKSRAAENFILYNRLSGESGTSSYELDLPNLGTSFVIGNLIEQGQGTENASILTYGLEGLAPGNPGHLLYVVNNTFVNDRPNGGTFVNIGTAVDQPALLENNIFSGSGTVTNQVSALTRTNFSGADPLLVDPVHFDYQLQAGSPCIDHGTSPDMVGSTDLTPVWQYVHPSKARSRVGVGAIDIGAYEFGSGNDASLGGASGMPGLSGAAGELSQGGSESAHSGAGGLTAAPSSNEGSGCSCRTTGSSRPRNAGFIGLLACAATVFGRRIHARRCAV